MISTADTLRKWRSIRCDSREVYPHRVGIWVYGTLLLFEADISKLISPLTFVAIHAVNGRIGYEGRSS